jgi:glyoxylase-like metal-dependent hydrolase (beta-lactamase superfamily II)
VVAGGYEVEAILDAEGSFATYAEAFPEATEDDRRLFDGERWVLPFRAYLIRGGGRTILVDTGVGPPGEGEFLPERQGWLPGELERLGAEPETVFLTHVHVDHIGWNHAYPSAKLVTHRDGVALSEERGRPLTGATAVEGETELAPRIVAFETPGHLPGHMSVRVGDELVILGDVAVHPAQLERPELAYVFDADPKQAARTRADILATYGDRTIACGHFPGSGFGR